MKINIAFENVNIQSAYHNIAFENLNIQSAYHYVINLNLYKYINKVLDKLCYANLT